MLSGVVAVNFFGLQACVYGPPPRDDARELERRLDSIHQILKERQNVESNDSNINMEEYRMETQRLEKEVSTIEEQLKSLKKENKK